MTLSIALDAVGGLALFLLAMLLMTEGLKVYAGRGLRTLLAKWTSTPLRGVFAGILITGIVQSSSAVTVATIGFVNAGVLTLRQALGVIFGTNVGTTMTGWLVSVVGFGFRIEAFALPVLALGVGLRLASSDRGRRGLGEALAGFGLFFLGLAVLRDAFGGLADAYGTAVAAYASGELTVAQVAVFLAAGFVATLLTQSSSAAVALVLTAAAGGMVPVESAAAAVIGANVGTTPKAVLASLGATPSARRLALGHVVFNVATALIALALLPALVHLVRVLADAMHVEGSPAAVLALFHTTFNVLGVLVMLPLAGRLATLLERAFVSAEEELGRPQHLDATVAATPQLAVDALEAELRRLRIGVAELAGGVLASGTPTADLERRTRAVADLVAAIAGFAASVRTEPMSAEASEGLADALRRARHLESAAALAPLAEPFARRARALGGVGAADALLADAQACARLARDAAADRALPGAAAQAPDEPRGPAPAGAPDPAAALDRLQHSYQRSKSALLLAIVERRLSIEDADELLDAASALRRMLEQLAEAAPGSGS